MCLCCFCKQPGRDTLPALVRIVTDDEAKWAWLVRHRENGEVLLRATSDPHEHTSLVSASASLHLDKTEAELRNMWHVKKPDGTLQRLSEFQVYGEAAEEDKPVVFGVRSKCTGWSMTTATVPRPSAEDMRTKRIRSPSASARGRASRRTVAQPTTAVAQASGVPQTPQATTVASQAAEVLQAPATVAEAVAGTTAAASLPTAPYDLGGDPTRVAFLLESRPEWDEEIILELLGCGAKPRLVRVKRVLHGKFRSACCDFVQPNGRVVEDVWLPMGRILLEYPEHARHAA
jgi:hypothetical protein